MSDLIVRLGQAFVAFIVIAINIRFHLIPPVNAAIAGGFAALGATKLVAILVDRRSRRKSGP